jgi:hypothetical protein
VAGLVIWRGVEEWRAEAAHVDLGADRLHATGTQIGDDPRPYRLDYRLEAAERFVTRRLDVQVDGEDLANELVLERRVDGAWTVDGRVAEELADAVDCDLGHSPLTNLMPILRHRLNEAPGAEEFTMAWVAVPELTVVAERQRYTHLAPGLVRFESLDGQFAGFSAELELDDDGLVVFYPRLAQRV